MSITTKKLTRAFSYGGMTLPDPGTALSLEEVRDVYSTAYPELVSASIEGPVQVGETLTYTFKKGVGTKGKE